MKYPHQPPVYGKYSMAVIGNLGFAWDEERGEVLIAILIEGSKFTSTHEGFMRKRQEYQSRLRANRRPKSVFPSRALQTPAASPPTEKERADSRSSKARRRATEKEWRAADRVARDARRAKAAAE